MEERSLTNDRKYSNRDITVYWKPSACVHASHCYRELIEVFNPHRRPWVNMKAAPTDEIIEVVNMCPTEALTWKWNDMEKNINIDPDQTNHVKFRRPELIDDNITDSVERPAMVKVLVDGSVMIKGDFTLIHAGETLEYKDNVISVCRCGLSNRMPFCDGHHTKTGFTG
jgi:uncharacterized Fe-S cluster protein YjdI